MAVQRETIQVTGVRCDRCVMRLAGVLQGQEGLLEANANLLGEVTLAWDDDLVSRDALLSTIGRGGFHQLAGAATGAE
jgi:hypothetical protein